MVTTIMVGIVALVIGGWLGFLFSPFALQFRHKEPRIVERVVFGDAAKTLLYEVWAPDTSSEKIAWMGGHTYAEGKNEYYTTCEQAHATHPGQEVQAKEALIVGDTYVIGRFSVVEVQPKPKVAKGRK